MCIIEERKGYEKYMNSASGRTRRSPSHLKVLHSYSEIVKFVSSCSISTLLLTTLLGEINPNFMEEFIEDKEKKKTRLRRTVPVLFRSPPSLPCIFRITESKVFSGEVCSSHI